MIELKVNKGEVTVVDCDGTLGEQIQDILDIIRYFYLSNSRDTAQMTFQHGSLDGVVNEGGDAKADEAWAWMPPAELMKED